MGFIEISLIILNRLMGHVNLRIAKIGNSFGQDVKTLKRLEKNGQNINDLLEKNAQYSSAIGQRDRICNHILNNINLPANSKIMEIGPGTGRFSEIFIKIQGISQYILIETHKEWRNYLKKKLRKINTTEVIAPIVDGYSLIQFNNQSVDFIHAHGVFIYLTPVDSFSYLNEIIRVSSKNAYVYFDFFSSEAVDVNVMKDWLESGHKFPIFLPEKIVIDMFETSGFKLVASWSEIYTVSETKNVIFERVAN